MEVWNKPDREIRGKRFFCQTHPNTPQSVDNNGTMNWYLSIQRFQSKTNSSPSKGKQYIPCRFNGEWKIYIL